MKIKYTIIVGFLVLFFTACTKFLDRPPLTVENDETAWTSEDNVRLYANEYYTEFFKGYGTGFGYDSTALMGFRFSDDVLELGNQGNFTRAVPNSEIWKMESIRSLNVMIDRLETKMQDILTEESYEHWMGIGKFFRAFRYSKLVSKYGDVPYYDHVVSDIDRDDLYKPRTPRNEVMDAVYDDFKFALSNVRLDDGDQNVNRYVVAGIVSRLALYEGTWQKYYYKDNERAKKFLDLAVEAGDLVIQSGKYDIDTDYRKLFTSLDLKGNKEAILYRHYDATVGVQHAIASNGNLSESIFFGPTTDLIKSYICNDGMPWQNSSVDDASDFEIANLIKTRDSRFEASYHRKPQIRNRASLLYITKFLPRDIEKLVEEGNSPPPEFAGAKNETDYPVLRYAEVLLNWIEAKAELGEVGGSGVNQDDLDASVNKIRKRPLADEAIERGVKKTAPLSLSAMPQDPSKDPTVSALLWEIRRERRMEFTFESSRIADLERWHKLDYMDTDTRSDLLSGAWVNFPEELPGELNSGNVGKVAVVSLSGQIEEYNGTNKQDMIGFYRHTSNNGRQPYLNQVNVNPYLSPVGKNQMDDYISKGFVLKQTEGWPQN